MLNNFQPENFRLNTEQVFEGLSPEEYSMLMSSSVTHVYRKGEVIFREGGIPAGIFYIRRGRAKKYKATVKGGEQILYICCEGELLGYYALLGDKHYLESSATLEESEITFIPKEAFLHILHQSPVLSFRLLKVLANECSFFSESITNLATKTVRERLAFALLVLEEKYRTTDNSGNVAIRISRTDLANFVSTAKETLVRALQLFKNKRLVKTTTTSITLVNRKGLLAEANLLGKR